MANGHGGRRPGAGRKPGTPGVKGPKPITKVRMELAERVLGGDITPLEVLIEAMREAHLVGNTREAAHYANMAAPYVHPKLSTINATHDGDIRATVQIVSEFSDA